MAETLKPCPLCGGTDLKHYVTNARERNRGVIVCKDCGLRLEAYSDDEYKVAQAYQGDFESAHEFAWEQARAAVADKWNRRAERTCHAVASHGDHGPLPRFPGDAWTMHHVCSACRGAIDADDEFCRHCGARLVGA